MKYIVTVAIATLILCMPLLPGEKNQMNDETNKNREKEQSRLLELDRELSGKAAKEGVLKAFLPKMTDFSTLFPLIGHPVMGKQAGAAIIKSGTDNRTLNRFEWTPLYAGVSAAGKLGYSIGRFARKKDVNAKVRYDYYGTIWRKNSHGQWRIAVSLGLLQLQEAPQKALEKSETVALKGVSQTASAAIKAESDFSQYSQHHGTTAAFYIFMAEKGIALSFSGSPRTKEVYKNALAKENATKNQKAPEGILGWEPYYSFTDTSADLAYNYGPYVYKEINDAGVEQINRGYFVTVWQYQPDNTWKFVFDGGNRL